MYIHTYWRSGIRTRSSWNAFTYTYIHAYSTQYKHIRTHTLCAGGVSIRGVGDTHYLPPHLVSFSWYIYIYIYIILYIHTYIYIWLTNKCWYTRDLSTRKWYIFVCMFSSKVWTRPQTQAGSVWGESVARGQPSAKGPGRILANACSKTWSFQASNQQTS